MGPGDGVALVFCTPAAIVYTWSGERTLVIAVASGVVGSLPWYLISVLMRITSGVCLSVRVYRDRLIAGDAAIVTDP